MGAIEMRAQVVKKSIDSTAKELNALLYDFSGLNQYVAGIPTEPVNIGNSDLTLSNNRQLDFDGFTMQWIGLGEFYAEATNAPGVGNASFEFAGYGTTSSDAIFREANGAGSSIRESFGNKQIIHYGKTSIGNDLGLPFIFEVDGTGLSSRGIYAQSSGLVAIKGYDSSNVGLNGQTDTGVAVYAQATDTINGYGVQSFGKVALQNLPTSSAGLSAGDIWNDAGTLKIV